MFMGFQYLCVSDWPATMPPPTIASVRGFPTSTLSNRHQAGELIFDGVTPSASIANNWPTQEDEAAATPPRPGGFCARDCAQHGGCGDGKSLCGCANDGGAVQFGCAGGGTINAVAFAAVGNPAGACGSFTRGSCDGTPAKAIAYVAKQCMGKANCTLSADINTFNGGADPCPGVGKHVEVQVTCSTLQPPPPPPPGVHDKLNAQILAGSFLRWHSRLQGGLAL